MHPNSIIKIAKFFIVWKCKKIPKPTIGNYLKEEHKGIESFCTTSPQSLQC